MYEDYEWKLHHQFSKILGQIMYIPIRSLTPQTDIS